MKILRDFKQFAMQGNIIDLAVGIIIGSAFGKIVTSLVNDIIMPPIGVLIAGIKFSDFKYVLKEATVDETGKAVDAVTINYGNFIQAGIDFIIVAFCIFLVIRSLQRFKKKEAEVAAVAAPSEEVKLLSEIRDLLKK